jgi:hypothetical protein
MACNWVETTFNNHCSLQVSINISGTTASLVLQNVGRNIVDIRRILLSYIQPNGFGTILFLRPPGKPISWSYPYETLEPGLMGTFYTLTGLTPGMIVQAQAEYSEVDARSRSCQFTV